MSMTAERSSCGSRRDGWQVSVAVADDGVGIDPQTLPTLFTRFSHGADHTGRPGASPTASGWRWSARSPKHTTATSR